MVEQLPGSSIGISTVHWNMKMILVLNVRKLWVFFMSQGTHDHPAHRPARYILFLLYSYMLTSGDL